MNFDYTVTCSGPVNMDRMKWLIWGAICKNIQLKVHGSIIDHAICIKKIMYHRSCDAYMHRSCDVCIDQIMQQKYLWTMMSSMVI